MSENNNKESNQSAYKVLKQNAKELTMEELERIKDKGALDLDTDKDVIISPWVELRKGKLFIKNKPMNVEGQTGVLLATVNILRLEFPKGTGLEKTITYTLNIETVQSEEDADNLANDVKLIQDKDFDFYFSLLPEEDEIEFVTLEEKLTAIKESTAEQHMPDFREKYTDYLQRANFVCDKLQLELKPSEALLVVEDDEPIFYIKDGEYDRFYRFSVYTETVNHGLVSIPMDPQIIDTTSASTSMLYINSFDSVTCFNTSKEYWDFFWEYLPEFAALLYKATHKGE